MLRAFLDILFPPLCHSCRAFIAEPTPLHLCADCRMRIVPIGAPFCPVCGVPFATEGGSNHPCGACLTTRRPFSAARAAARFDGPVQDLIHRCKYGKKVHLAKPLAHLMAESLTTFVSDAVPDCLVPVPLHGKRLRQRGFNQAQQLAGFLAKRWQLPHSVDNLRRIRWTEPQTGLAAVDRQRNIRDAFAVADPGRFKDKRLLLVDDVYTTGSTAAECAKTLRHAGASSVMVITVARAVI